MFELIGEKSAQALGLEGHAAEAMQFFVGDTVKILLLLFGMVFVMGIVRSYISREKVKAWLTGKRAGIGNLIASIFGTITPFCSCSSIPIFIGFIEAGIPAGIGLSFLITSPLVNEYVAVLMWSFFGWKIAVAYILSGILIGVIGGMVLGRMDVDKLLQKDIISNGNEKEFKVFKDRVIYGLDESLDILKKVWIWVIAGVALGAILHGFVPDELLQNLVSKGGLFAVPIAVALGVPLYANCSAVIPIAVVLFEKGVPLGTALAFMMATSALSMPEAVILRRVMKLKLILLFFGTTALGILFLGYLFNILSPLLT